MRAEERLKQHRHAITVVGESGKIEPGISQRAIVDACEAYDIAREAITLLREFVSIRRGSARNGDYPVAQYGARMACWRKKVYKFLEGGGDES